MIYKEYLLSLHNLYAGRTLRNTPIRLGKTSLFLDDSLPDLVRYSTRPHPKSCNQCLSSVLLFSRVCPLISAFLIPKKQTVFLRMFSLRVGAGKLFKNYRCLIRFGTTTDGGSLILIHMEEEDNRRRGGGGRRQLPYMRGYKVRDLSLHHSRNTSSFTLVITRSKKSFDSLVRRARRGRQLL
jgi:hypothetical protein